MVLLAAMIISATAFAQPAFTPAPPVSPPLSQGAVPAGVAVTDGTSNEVTSPVTLPTVTPLPAEVEATPEVSGPPLPPSAPESVATSTPAAVHTPSSPDPTSPNSFGSTSAGRAAFSQMVRNLMPLSPDQIVTLRDMFDRSQKAVSQYPGIPPKPTSSSIMVNMSPGATPPVIRLRAGYVTSLVFLDSSGQPWPVVGYDLGNPKAFNIQPSAPNGKSNSLLVQAVDRYEEGNLAVMLKDEDTPVMITLMPGQRAVDYRVDLNIPGLGPNALVAMSGLPEASNPVLLNFLDGVPPLGAKLLRIVGAPAQVWLYRGHLFLRTRVTVLSPGWLASMSSPDGTHVYELPKTPVILASQRGAMLQLSIKGL